MTSSFIGEIRAFPYTYAPQGWLDCGGQQLPVSSFQALFSIIGYTYGGSSAVFAVPDLRGAAAIGFKQKPGTSYYELGERTGTETVALNDSTIPPHTHTFNGATGATASRESAPAADNQSYLTDIAYTPTGASRPDRTFGYLDQPNNPVNLNTATLTPAWGNAVGTVTPHENCSPFLVMRYCICYDGDYPPFQ